MSGPFQFLQRTPLIEIDRCISGRFGASPSLLERPVVAVHPYFTWVPGGYEQRLEEFVRKYGGPIITLEEEDTMDRTAARFISYEGPGARFFVKTRKANPTPVEITWTDVVDFLKRFEYTDIDLVGGYRNTPHLSLEQSMGCLGFTQRVLQVAHFRTQVIPELSFGRL